MVVVEEELMTDGSVCRQRLMLKESGDVGMIQAPIDCQAKLRHPTNQFWKSARGRARK